MDLQNMLVAVIATDGVEESELTEPVNALKNAGAEVKILSNHTGNIQAFNHLDKGNTINVDGSISQESPENYDAILLPGGAVNADQIRTIPEVKNFITDFVQKEKPMAVICHAPWELISAGVVKGRTLTSWPSIQDDLKNAGANWVDQEVVVDRNIVSSRKPDDIPAFNEQMIKLFSEAKGNN